MTRLCSKTLGYYIPSFFEMYIDTNIDDLTINRLPIRDMTILFHEYIHFLQDFTTFYGLSAIYTHSEYLHSVVNRIYNHGSNSFSVPFEIKDNNDNVLLNRQISKLTLGDTSEIDILKISDITKSSDELLPNVYFNAIPNRILCTEDNFMIFGAMAIMENMAYLMERCCSPKGYEKSPDFPYTAAEKVAEFYSPEFARDKLKVLALCDMSLQCSNPGVCFVNIMEGVAEKRLVFDTPESIYDYFYSQETVHHGSLEQKSFIEQYKIMLMRVQTQLKGYLQNMPMLESYYKWIDNIVRFALDWRENDPYFLLKMANHADLATNGCWGKAVHDVGTPLMVNSLGHYFKILSNDCPLDMDVEYFRALREIENLFETGKVECSMYDWCTNSLKSSPNDLCNVAPWDKCSEKELCPYALFWRHWKLSGYKPLQK